MPRTIVAQFITVDGVVDDPDGSFGSPVGGWGRRHGPETFAGDTFDLEPLMAAGAALLLGRRTWDLFADRWPERSGGFADAMNDVPKLVATRSLADVSRWSGSSVLGGELVAAVAAERERRDVLVAGSTAVVHQLLAADLVDELRLLVLPFVVGGGTPLFPAGAAPLDLRLASMSASVGGALLRYERA